MSIVTTDRLTLREMTPSDLDDMAALLGDEQVMRYYPRTKTRDEARRWIEWNRSLYRDHGFGLWAITLTETGAFVGDCGLTIQRIDGVDEVEVGYHVRTEYQRRGYATEAAAASRDLARDRYSIGRLIAVINADNQPSTAVAERIGLRFEKHASVYGQDRLIYAANLAGLGRPG
ncbi:GNAT family N-acetyltransferase [Nakamurella lactea]|uniref:GNAT family N-acetyltransferase n=1 Tax=Nakamurella lactea TaxID=459515 RepID=UPI00042574CE|nr:GNAT family N-acetyltransferase [Nakamurella lactea]